MKKIITSLLLFTVISLKAQFSIYYIASPILCPGDTISILFMWKNAPAQCQFNIAQGVNNQIYSVNGFTFHTLPKSIIAGDTIYMIKFKTSGSFQLGTANVSTNWVNTTPIYFFCETVGLPEQYPDKPKPIYRELYGTILVDQYGRKIIKCPE